MKWSDDNVTEAEIELKYIRQDQGPNKTESV